MHQHIPHTLLESLLNSLSFYQFSLTDFILSTIQCSESFASPYKTDFIHHLHLWLDTFSLVPDANEVLRSWVHEAAKVIYAEELEALTHPSHGFRYNASNATLDQIEEFSLVKLENMMQNYSPHLYELIFHLLVANSTLEARRVMLGNDVERLNEDGEELLDDEQDLWAQIDGVQPEDLFENLLYEDCMEVDEEHEDTGDGLNGQQRKRHKAAVMKRAAVRRIRCFMIISVLMVTTNQHCNAFGGTFGFFFHSKNVPQSVIQVLHRFGLSDSVQSINNAVNSMSKKSKERMFRAGRTLLCSVAYDNFDFNLKTNAPTIERDNTFVHAVSATLVPLAPECSLDDLRCSAEVYAKLGLDLDNPRAKVCWSFRSLIGIQSVSSSNSQPLATQAHTANPRPASVYSSRQERQWWHIVSILVEHCEGLQQFKTNLGSPKSVFPLPVRKTEQIPLTAMALNQSTLEGNIQALQELNRQCGIGANAVSGTDIPAISLENIVRLTHGDLGTLEKLESLILSRRIEKTPEDRLQYVIPVMGLFHLKMAVVDALWKTYIEPRDAQVDSQTVFAYISILRPKETGKFLSKPGFRRMHDIVHHITYAAILDCWRLVIAQHNSALTSLESFVQSEPSWDEIERLGWYIVQNFVAGVDFPKMRRQPSAQRDRLLENSHLRNRDFLDYIELCHAINWGDIGRIEELFIPFACLCQSTGKTKYSSHLIQHIGRMKFVYPESLRKIIRMNWLVNPTGKPDGFRPVDWLVELNNLYTKVIYGGSFSNRSLELMLKQSPLIEIFRMVHQIVNDVLHIRHQTVRHSLPNMHRTLERLRAFMSEGRIHEFVIGWEDVKYEIPDQFRESLDVLNKM